VEDYSGWSPLHRAVQEDKREAVPLLMQRGASLTVTGNDGKTPSDLIVSEEMRVLFCTREDAGAALYDRVAAKDMLGVSSICNRFCGDVSVLNHPNSSQHDYAPLHKAIIDSGGRPEIAACLLDAGAHVDAKERGGWTALHHASNRDFLDIVLLLLSRGASTTSRSAIGQSPVHVAKTEAMKMLFNNHADGGNYGYMSGPWITGRRPVQSVQVLSGSDIVYMIKDDGYVKMVTSNGVAKYYTGELADFDPNKWNQYNDAGRNYRHEPA
jgi:hypothetical protein